MKMKPKSVITIVLLAFVLGSVIFLIAGESQQNSKTAKTKEDKVVTSDAAAGLSSSTENKAKETLSESSHKVIAYYFHSTARCPSCIKIEAYTKEALHRDFVKELKDGRLEWRPINVDEAGNSHYVTDYKLYTKSVIIADIKDGKQTQWKNLEKVWDLFYQKDVFLNYINYEVSAYLGKNP